MQSFRGSARGATGVPSACCRLGRLIGWLERVADHVEARLAGSPPNLFSVANKNTAVRADRAGNQRRDPDRSHRLLRRSTARTRDPRDADTNLASEAIAH